MTHPSSLPLEGFAVLNDTPVACQTRVPTDPQRDRCPRRGRMRCRRAPARATFVCGDKSSQKHRLDLRSKNPSRAILSCDFLRILAGIAFCRRCRIKGLCLCSPARRLTRPLASATAGVFRSYRRTPKPSPWRSAVLNDTPVACQTRGPTRRETGVSEADG